MARPALVLGKNIRRLRKERSWSQADLAEKAGLSIPTVSRLETGDTWIGQETLQGIAEVFGVPLHELLLEGAPPAKVPVPVALMEALRVINAHMPELVLKRKTSGKA